MPLFPCRVSTEQSCRLRKSWDSCGFPSWMIFGSTSAGCPPMHSWAWVPSLPSPPTGLPSGQKPSNHSVTSVSSQWKYQYVLCFTNSLNLLPKLIHAIWNPTTWRKKKIYLSIHCLVLLWVWGMIEAWCNYWNAQKRRRKKPDTRAHAAGMLIGSSPETLITAEVCEVLKHPNSLTQLKCYTS